MKSRIFVSVVVALVLALGILFAWRHQHSRPSPDVTVGVILAITGPADFIGKPENQVLAKLLPQLQATAAADPGISLEVRDSGGRPEQALVWFQQFLNNEKVVAVIGPSTSGESILLADEMQRSEVKLPLLSLAASRTIVLTGLNEGTPATRPWVFKFAQNDDLAAERLARLLITRGHNQICFLHSEDGFGKSGVEAFKATIAHTGQLRVHHEVPFPAQLERPEPIVASIPKEIEAVVLWGTSPGPALLVQELRRSRPHLPIYLSHGNASHTFIRDAGPASEGAVVVGSRVLLAEEHLNENQPADKVILDFREFWRQHFAGQPSHFGGHARDALAMLSEVLRTGDRTRQGIRDRLEETRNWPGVTGVFSFSTTDHAGLPLEAFALYEISGGAFVPLAGQR